MAALTAIDKYAVRLAMLAILVELTVSANLLTLLGVPYIADGGSILLKLHPGTDLLAVAFALLVARRGSWAIVVSQSQVIAFLSLVAACMFYMLILTGTSNLVVLLDTFLPAGLLATILSRAHPGQLRHLRLLMQLLLLMNALLALAETGAQTTLIPLYLDNFPYHPHQQDFRPTALFDHPLTGSIMALLGLALAPRQRWCRLAFSGLMWAALLAYGGRAGLAAALIMICGGHSARTASMILRRNPQAPRRVCAAAILLIAAVLTATAALHAGLGTRVAGRLYWDDSAQVRLAQWRVLDQLDIWQVLFGTRREDLLSLLVSLRLGTGVEVIENFWLLMFISLGLFGFPLFLGAMLALLTWSWRISRLQGRLLVFGVLLVASCSNSIGRKSTVLVCTVAAVACLSVRPHEIRRTTSRLWAGARLATT